MARGLAVIGFNPPLMNALLLKSRDDLRTQDNRVAVVRIVRIDARANAHSLLY